MKTWVIPYIRPLQGNILCCHPVKGIPLSFMCVCHDTSILFMDIINCTSPLPYHVKHLFCSVLVHLIIVMSYQPMLPYVTAVLFHSVWHQIIFNFLLFTAELYWFQSLFPSDFILKFSTLALPLNRFKMYLTIIQFWNDPP